jgi:hypothetical protein
VIAAPVSRSPCPNKWKIKARLGINERNFPKCSTINGLSSYFIFSWTYSTKNISVFKLLLTNCSRSSTFFCPYSGNRTLLPNTKAIRCFSNVTLLPLPPYSPELNPVEQLWQQIKQRFLSNTTFQNYDDIIA